MPSYNNLGISNYHQIHAGIQSNINKSSSQSKNLDLYQMKKTNRETKNNIGKNVASTNPDVLRKTRNENMGKLQDKENNLKNEVRNQQGELASIEFNIKEKKENLNKIRNIMSKKVYELDEKRQDLEEDFWKKKDILEEQLAEIKKNNNENFVKLRENIEGLHKRNLESGMKKVKEERY